MGQFTVKFEHAGTPPTRETVKALIEALLKKPARVFKAPGSEWIVTSPATGYRLDNIVKGLLRMTKDNKTKRDYPIRYPANAPRGRFKRIVAIDAPQDMEKTGDEEGEDSV